MIVSTLLMSLDRVRLELNLAAGSPASEHIGINTSLPMTLLEWGYVASTPLLELFDLGSD
jgi:hypothetical protein